MKRYSVDCVRANHTMTPRSGLNAPETAWSSSAVYLSRMEHSIAREDTVRMAVTDSEAIAELVDNLSEMSRSMRPSNSIFNQPQPTTIGSPANTMTKPNFHANTIPKMLQAAMFKAAMRMKAMLKPINSKTACGCASIRLVSAPILFSGRSKNWRSC
jgi:hypothetical protein